MSKIDKFTIHSLRLTSRFNQSPRKFPKVEPTLGFCAFGTMPYKSIQECSRAHNERKRKAEHVETIIQRSNIDEVSPAEVLNGVAYPELALGAVSERHIQYEMSKRRKVEDGIRSVRDKRTILLDQERVDLAQYAKASADANDPQYKPLLRGKICEILSNRQSRLRTLYSQQRPLSELAMTKAELNCLDHPTTLPSDEWFNSFFGEFKEHIPLRTVVHKDVKRIATCNIQSINDHFYSQQGILSTMMEAGIFDAATGRFDPSRIANMDETSEFFCYEQSTKGRCCKVPGGSRKGPVVAAQQDQRETYTVNMIIGGDGFMYGPQIIFAAEQLTSAHDITNDLPTVGFSQGDPFDNIISERMSSSSFLLVSPTSKGVQTTTSLKHRLEMFHRELTLRGVQFPFVLMLDNHTSRFNEEVARWCVSHREDIIMWVANPNTTSWAQALDQINHRFHQSSHRAKREYVNQICVRNSCRPHEVKLHQKV